MSNPQTPTVGRIVHVYSSKAGMTLPAVITRVWSPDCVNLRVISDDDAPLEHRTSRLYSDQLMSNELYWAWPPRVWS